MKKDLEIQPIIDLFIPLNTDTLSSYLTPILAQYNLQYNDFMNFFLKEYQIFLGSYFKEFIVTEIITENILLSHYNLKIRVELILTEIIYNNTPKYHLKFKPLILPHLFLYYIKTIYHTKRRLELINIFKMGSFIWWNTFFNIFDISKKKYQILKLYVVIKKYKLKKISYFLKKNQRELYTYKLCSQRLRNIKYTWIYNQKFQIKSQFLQYYKIIKNKANIILFYFPVNFYNKKKIKINLYNQYYNINNISFKNNKNIFKSFIFKDLNQLFNWVNYLKINDILLNVTYIIFNNKKLDWKFFFAYNKNIVNNLLKIYSILIQDWKNVMSYIYIYIYILNANYQCIIKKY